MLGYNGGDDTLGILATIALRGQGNLWSLNVLQWLYLF